MDVKTNKKGSIFFCLLLSNNISSLSCIIYVFIESNKVCPSCYLKIPKWHSKVESNFHNSGAHFSLKPFLKDKHPIIMFCTNNVIVINKKLNKIRKKDCWNMNEQLKTLLWCADNFSIRMVTDVLHHVLQSQPCLGGCRDDLIGWEDEAVATSVPKLKGKRVLNAEVVGPVDAAATGLICREK